MNKLDIRQIDYILVNKKTMKHVGVITHHVPESMAKTMVLDLFNVSSYIPDNKMYIVRSGNNSYKQKLEILKSNDDAIDALLYGFLALKRGD